MKKRARRRLRLQIARFSINGTIVNVKFTKKLGVRMDKDDGYTLVMIRKYENGKITLIEYHAEVPAIIDNPHITEKELKAIKKQIRTFNKEKANTDKELAEIFIDSDDLPKNISNMEEIGFNSMFA